MRLLGGLLYFGFQLAHFGSTADSEGSPSSWWLWAPTAAAVACTGDSNCTTVSGTAAFNSSGKADPDENVEEEDCVATGGQQNCSTSGRRRWWFGERRRSPPPAPTPNATAEGNEEQRPAAEAKSQRWCDFGWAMEGGLQFCGWICTSIGFASRWGPWLFRAFYITFWLQSALFLWKWLVLPCVLCLTTVWEYLMGITKWADTAPGAQSRFRVGWVGPHVSTPWSNEHVQSVKARGEKRAPHDLLVTDGAAVARIVHPAISQRANRHGLMVDYESVHSCSLRYYRGTLLNGTKTLHLCSAQPCGVADDAEIHVLASCSVPRTAVVDVNTIAQQGPLARMWTVARWAMRGLRSVLAIALYFCACKCCRKGTRTRRATESAGLQLGV